MPPKGYKNGSKNKSKEKISLGSKGSSKGSKGKTMDLPTKATSTKVDEGALVPV